MIWHQTKLAEQIYFIQTGRKYFCLNFYTQMIPARQSHYAGIAMGTIFKYDITLGTILKCDIALGSIFTHGIVLKLKML
jgi:hypothetical protein